MIDIALQDRRIEKPWAPHFALSFGATGQPDGNPPRHGSV